MEVRRAVLNGIVTPDLAFEPLVQVASLRDVDWNPLAILGLPGINVVTRQRPEGGFHREDLVRVLTARLAGPVDPG